MLKRNLIYKDNVQDEKLGKYSKIDQINNIYIYLKTIIFILLPISIYRLSNFDF
jgi:hypothetical protein